MSKSPALAPMLVPTQAGGSVRLPKTAELVAGTLRRMIVDGQLTEGDFLPHEAELMSHFQISRPTLREAVRILESERLVEVRRGSRTGARVRVPGPEIVARPAGLLLELSGATIADVIRARSALEPAAAAMLAESGDVGAADELGRIIEDKIAAEPAKSNLARTTALFHRRMVELSGNKTLAMVVGMIHEITERHTANTIDGVADVTPADFRRLVKSYRRLIDLVRSGDGAAAAAHWQRHMERESAALLAGHEQTMVRDVIR